MKNTTLFPLVSVDVALFSIVEGSLRVLLVQRAQAPESMRWALPGGVLKPDIDANLESTARRVMRNKVCVEIPHLEEVQTFSGPDRDPRGWSVSVLYWALLPYDQINELVKDKVAREKRRLKTAKIINTVLLVAAVASDVSSSSRRQTGETWVRNRITHDGVYNLIQAKRVIDHGTFANRMQRYDFESYRWRELALRRTYIQPGESVRGFVYLPKAMQASYVKMLYPMPETGGITLTFMQSTTKQKPK